MHMLPAVDDRVDHRRAERALGGELGVELRERRGARPQRAVDLLQHLLRGVEGAVAAERPERLTRHVEPGALRGRAARSL